MTRHPGTSVRNLVLALVAMASIVLPLAVVVLDGARGWPSGAFYLAFAPAPVAFAVVGWLIAVRRPGIVIGPLCLLFGLVFAIYFPIDLLVHLDSMSPALALAATFSSASDAPGFIIVAMILVLFPDGRLPGPGWGWTVVVAAVGSAAAIVGFALDPGPLAAFPSVVNPIGVERFPGDIVGEIGYISLLALLVAAVGGLVTRWRRGRPAERAQVKWVSAASVVLLVAEAANLATFDPTDPLGSPVIVVTASAGTALVPAAIGVAVFRYRLYDIDRIVSRTIGWAMVTGVLVAVFAAAIVGLQALLAPFTNNDTLAVATSTLLAAAMFQPVRARVQRAVDRRFNRSRVDAQAAIDAFGTHLRDEVDLAALHGRLLATAHAAVQPRDAALWTRDAGR